MRKRIVLLSLLSLIICMPSFADEYTPKKNPNFRAKAFSVSPKRKVYFTQGNLISQRFDDGDIAFMTNQFSNIFGHISTLVKYALICARWQISAIIANIEWKNAK